MIRYYCYKQQHTFFELIASIVEKVNVDACLKAMLEAGIKQEICGSTTYSAGIASLAYKESEKFDFSIPCECTSTDENMKLLMCIMTNLADVLEPYTGPIWGGQSSEYMDCHKTFASYMVSRPSTDGSIDVSTLNDGTLKIVNRCEGITVAITDNDTIVKPHVDKFNDDRTESFNYVLSLSYWIDIGGESKRLAIVGYSCTSCRAAMHRITAMRLLPVHVSTFVKRLPNDQVHFSHQLLDENFGKTFPKKSKQFVNLNYFARYPHINRTIYVSAYID